MASSKVVKVCLAYPWYNGPDPYAAAYFLEFQHYLGRLSERSKILAKMPREDAEALLKTLPPIDPMDGDGSGEFTPDLIGTEFEFATGLEMFLSLVGKARENIVDGALDWGADYLFWTDDDMVFRRSAFLQLYRNDVDICGALAFTSRRPVLPVIYRFTDSYCEDRGRDITDIQPIQDYQKDTLQVVDAIGAGVMLTKSEVFRRMKKPWFDSTGLGEDIHFCYRATREYKIPVHVDTRVKTHHKAAMPSWHDEDVYIANQQAMGQPVPA